MCLLIMLGMYDRGTSIKLQIVMQLEQSYPNNRCCLNRFIEECQRGSAIEET